MFGNWTALLLLYIVPLLLPGVRFLVMSSPDSRLLRRYVERDSERSKPRAACTPLEVFGPSAPYRTMTKKTSPRMAVATRPMPRASPAS